MFHKQYTSSLDASRHVADDIVPFWQQLRLDENIIAQMELCIVEIVNNVFEHAYANIEGPSFEICSHLDDKQLTIEICDYGTAMPNQILEDLPTTDFVEPVANDSSTWLQSNRGLKIVQQLADSLEYTSNKKCNTFKLVKGIAYN